MTTEPAAENPRRPTPRFDPATYQRFVLPHYADKDPAHDANHIRRIFGRLPGLVDDVGRPVRSDRLWFLAAFHGLAGRADSDTSFRQQAERFLTGLGWQPHEIDELFAALARHTSDPQTVEEQIVQDANALEVVGAFGIAKTFLKGGYEHQSYEQTLALYCRFLDEVRFLTPAGQRIAQERRAFAEAFLERFTAEATIGPGSLETP